MIIYEIKRDLENAKNALLSLKMEFFIRIQSYINKLTETYTKLREDYEGRDELNYTIYVNLISSDFKERFLIGEYEKYLKIQIYNHACDSLSLLFSSELFYEHVIKKEEISEIKDKHARFIAEVDNILAEIEKEYECRRKADDKFYKGKRMKSTLIPLLF